VKTIVKDECCEEGGEEESPERDTEVHPDKHHTPGSSTVVESSSAFKLMPDDTLLCAFERPDPSKVPDGAQAPAPLHSAVQESDGNETGVKSFVKQETKAFVKQEPCNQKSPPESSVGETLHNPEDWTEKKQIASWCSWLPWICNVFDRSYVTVPSLA